MIVDIIELDTKIKYPECQYAWNEKTPMTVDGFLEKKVVSNYLWRKVFEWWPIFAAGLILWVAAK